MEKSYIITMFLLLGASSIFATNLDNIYGKNDLDLNRSRGDLYGTNFGSILDYDSLAPRQINIESALKEIESLSEEIIRFKTDIDHYKNRGDEERSQKAEITSVINKIDLLVIELKSTSAELFSAKGSQTDSNIRQKLQNSIEENRQQIYDLTNRRAVLVAEKENLSRSIETADRFVTLNNLFIRKNNSRISYLESCIEYTGRETGSAEILMEKSSSYQKEVDTLINVSF